MDHLQSSSGRVRISRRVWNGSSSPKQYCEDFCFPQKKILPPKHGRLKSSDIIFASIIFNLILLFRPPSSDLAFLHPAWYPVAPASSPWRVEFKGYPWIEIITLRNLMSIWSTSYDSSTAVSILCILYITYNFESMTSWFWIKRQQLIAIPWFQVT